MSENTQTPSYQDAYLALKERVYQPVYFGKLASDYGIQPADTEEAQLLLVAPEHLRSVQGNELNKVAGVRKSILKESLTGISNTGSTLPPSAVDNQVKAAASGVMQQYPDLKDAALLYRDFLAQVAAQQA